MYDFNICSIAMSKNKLTKLSELMVITMEECGELIQACSKAIRCNDYHNDSLKEEIGDVMCMIELIKSNGLITQREIDNQIQTKRMKLMKWSKLL
jgi:NTP pyrophosphatase (non-canonical NTP hydrolase)